MADRKDKSEERIEVSSSTLFGSAQDSSPHAPPGSIMDTVRHLSTAVEGSDRAL